MIDVLYIVLTLLFFGLTGLLVIALEKLMEEKK